MVNEYALTVSLEEFGLSKYEAQAYVALISKGTISAAELAYYSDIPRTKIYPTLLKLENKKLAIISKSKPIMCTAIAPEDAFDSIIHEQINKVNAMNTLVSNLKKASEESRKSRGSEEKRYFHVSANNVLEQLRTMIECSKSSINIMADQWGLGLLEECKEQLLSVLRRNLEVRLLLPSAQICSESYRAIPNEVKIRISDIIQNCFVFDETEIDSIKRESTLKNQLKEIKKNYFRRDRGFRNQTEFGIIYGVNLKRDNSDPNYYYYNNPEDDFGISLHTVNGYQVWPYLFAGAGVGIDRMVSFLFSSYGGTKIEIKTLHLNSLLIFDKFF